MEEFVSTGIRYQDGRLEILDQQLLPREEQWVECRTPQDMFDSIFHLKVRGAPLIGVAASLAILQVVRQGGGFKEVTDASELIGQSRPTAVNLKTCLNRILEGVNGDNYSSDLISERVMGIVKEDVALCEGMGRSGADLIEDGDNVLTHCNTGGLATAGIGTALAVIRKAWDHGKKIHVFVDETRPLLQGGRLTTWELERLNIPYTLITDNMAGYLMQQKRINKAFVGSDRIATNGDFANKVGTYSVAVLCKHHDIPFYPVAPWTTVDLNCPEGKSIPIEERTADEVRGVKGAAGDLRWSPADCKVYNPAFDVTPAKYCSGWVLDDGLYNLEQFKAECAKRR